MRLRCRLGRLFPADLEERRLSHLALFFPIYAQQIYAAPEKDALRFEWGDAAGFVTDGLLFRTLVYDRSGASEAHLKASQPAEDGMRVYTRHLVGRFYVQTLH